MRSPGSVFDVTSLQGVAAAVIRCRWSGYDDILGNDDDVVFTTIADDSGSFDMAGVPYGYFICDGLDQLTGRASQRVAANVFSIDAVYAPLPVGSDPHPVGIPASGILPATGSDSLATVAFASS